MSNSFRRIFRKALSACVNIAHLRNLSSVRSPTVHRTVFTEENQNSLWPNKSNNCQSPLFAQTIPEIIRASPEFKMLIKLINLKRSLKCKLLWMGEHFGCFQILVCWEVLTFKISIEVDALKFIRWNLDFGVHTLNSQKLKEPTDHGDSGWWSHKQQPSTDQTVRHMNNMNENKMIKGN